MVPRNPKDTAASVRQRLLNASRATGEPFDVLLTRYGVERLLFRLDCSRWSHEFVLKGAMLFAIWHEIPMRPTRDVDLLGFGSPEVERLADIFRSICTQPVVEDGLTFDPGSVNADPIRETNAYHGVRIRLGATLAGAKIPIQVDVGFGDALVPDPEEIVFPTLLEFPAPTVRAYPIYTVISEKLQALTVLGMANSRMKNYYDLWTFAARVEIRGSTLVAAIRATFERRETPIPAETPLGLTTEFAEGVEKVRQWKAFAKKISTDPPIPTLDEVVGMLQECLCPALDAASSSGEELGQLWQPGGPWVRPFD